MPYDNITIGMVLSEKELETENRHIYNNSLIAFPTGNTSPDGSPEMKVISTTGGSGSYNQNVGKMAKLYRATISSTNSASKSLTIEIPAGRYVQISRYSAKLVEDGISTGTAVLNVHFGGTRIGGTLYQAYNYNSLSPAYSGFDMYEDAVIDTPDNTLVLDGYAYSSTNQTSDNTTYSVPDALLIFGDANNPTLITMEISATTVVYYLAIRVSLSEVDEDGTII